MKPQKLNIKNNQQIIVRNEQPSDFDTVENLTRNAFWNLYMPGCVEHYLAHKIRKHKDFIPELDLVAELDGQVVGNIMYTKALISDDNDNQKMVLTFGPIAVDPKYQQLGIGKTLIETSFVLAKELDYEIVVIFGMPSNYVSSGFKSSRDFNIATLDGRFPTAMLVKTLNDSALDDHQWRYQESAAMKIDFDEVAKFDQQFPPLTKAWQPSQEEFKIISRSFVDENSDLSL